MHVHLNILLREIKVSSDRRSIAVVQVDSLKSKDMGRVVLPPLFF